MKLGFCRHYLTTINRDELLGLPSCAYTIVDIIQTGRSQNFLHRFFFILDLFRRFLIAISVWGKYLHRGKENVEKSFRKKFKMDENLRGRKVSVRS